MADMLSQEEIDALLRGTSMDSEVEKMSLSVDEIDALGEIGNISMGTAATTLFTLVGNKVTITTPRVSETTTQDLSNYYTTPCVAVFIKYKEGIEGFNLLILKEKDVKIITDLMMGGDGTNISQELTDLHLSAISEAMNQMIGSASTSLSEIFNKKIDILPPEAIPIDLASEDYEALNLNKDDQIVRIAFNMTIGNIVDSEIMQIIPMKYAKQIVSTVLNSNNSKVEVEMKKTNTHETYKAPLSKAEKKDDKYNRDLEQEFNRDYSESPKYPKEDNTKKSVNVKPINFESFDEPINKPDMTNDIHLIKDVPLGITVELGRTVRKISEILNFGPGTVIELDKLVGEPLDIMANGKQIAKGEVVVVDENYGIRITDIIVNNKK